MNAKAQNHKEDICWVCQSAEVGRGEQAWLVIVNDFSIGSPLFLAIDVSIGYNVVNF